MSRKVIFTEFLFIILGAMLAAFSVACILLPNDAIDYGTAGIGIIINRLSGLNLSLCVMLTFLPFAVLGIFVLGRQFFFKSAAGTLAYMLGLEIFERIPFELNVEHFIAVAFGGALLGLGLSLILRSGGCIDGSEILANMLVERIRQRFGFEMSMSRFLLTFNAFVYTAAFLLIDRNNALLSLLVYVVATAVTDHLTDRYDEIKQLTIISQDPANLVEYIRSDMKKTCTIIDSHGAIAGSNSTVICYVTYFEMQKLKGLIRKLDKTAFITVSTIDEIIR